MFTTRARDAALTLLITRLIWYDHLIGRHILRPSDFGEIAINVGPFFAAFGGARFARAKEKGDHNMGAVSNLNPNPNPYPNPGLGLGLGLRKKFAADFFRGLFP